jgi:hypothetical protein
MTTVLVPSRLSHVQHKRISGHDLDGLMESCGSHLTFIGALVVERRLWLQRERESFYGCYFLHVAVIFQARLPADVIVLNKPCVSIRLGNASWTARSFEIWNLFWPSVIWQSRHVTERAKRHVIAERPWLSAAQLLRCRILGIFSILEYNRFIRESDVSLTRKALCLIIAIAPGHLLQLIAMVVLVFLGNRYRLQLHDVSLSRFNLLRYFTM